MREYWSHLQRWSYSECWTKEQLQTSEKLTDLWKKYKCIPLLSFKEGSTSVIYKFNITNHSPYWDQTFNTLIEIDNTKMREQYWNKDDNSRRQALKNELFILLKQKHAHNSKAAVGVFQPGSTCIPIPSLSLWVCTLWRSVRKLYGQTSREDCLFVFVFFLNKSNQSNHHNTCIDALEYCENWILQLNNIPTIFLSMRVIYISFLLSLS